MDEKKLASRLRGGDAAALSRSIDLYGAYVHAVVRSVARGALSREDMEEAAADAFTQLWYNRDKLRPGKLRSYLAAIARNNAISRLRALRIEPELDDDLPVADCAGPEYQALLTELSDMARAAVDSLPQPDREIFQRHYFLYQRSGEIAAQMDLKPATVRTKLARGREKLKAYLTERGYCSENLYI